MQIHLSYRSVVGLSLLVAACGGSTLDTGSLPDASLAAGGAGTGGSAGTTGGAGTTGSGAGGNAGNGTTGSGGSGAAGGTPDGGTCDAACGPSRTCCDGKCVNLVNDPTNCGACGTRCGGATPYCDGTCKPAPCDRDAASCVNGSCCGSECCSPNQLCCNPQGPLDRGPVCYSPTPDQPTCPPGCAPLCISDRNLKRDIEPVDPVAVLDAVSKLPVSTWSYRTDPESVRHMGPMAQDFKAAFGLGDTDRAYHAIDAHGVAFAAIQALYAIELEQTRKIERLEHENERLLGRIGALERQPTMH